MTGRGGTIAALTLMLASVGLWGCAAVPAAVWVGAAGGILAGTAALTNADVAAAKAYCQWRGQCADPVVAAPVATSTR